jgi:hypothetical protein
LLQCIIAQAELETADELGGDELVRLNRPRQAVVEAGTELRLEDTAEALSEGNLTGPDCDQAAAEIENSDRPGSHPSQAAPGKPIAREHSHLPA